MKQNQEALGPRLRLVTYVFTGSVLLFVVSDVLAVTWPMVFTEMSWRYGAVGLVAGALYHPLVAVLIALGVAVLTRDRAPIWALTLFSGLAVIFLLSLLGLMLLDLGDLRALTAEGQGRTNFDRASFLTVLKLGVGAVAFSLSTWVGAGELRAQRPRSQREAGVMIAGRE